MIISPKDSGRSLDQSTVGVSREKLQKIKHPGMGLTDCEPLSFDPVTLRGNRLAKVREMLKQNEYTACVLFDPYNQRYATGSRNMFGYFLRNSSRYFYIPAEGPIVLFDYPQSMHVSELLETVSEARVSKLTWSSALHKDGATASVFASEISDMAHTQGGKKPKIGMDRCSLNLAASLEALGCEVVDCNQDMLHTRRIKTEEEITCLKLSLINTEAAVYQMRENIRPGVSEQELFADFYRAILAGGGEFVETRLLSSGPRTNPWFHEASAKRLRPGELVGFDTDAIGTFGYFSDFSRTFHCGPGRPNGEQKTLYQLSYEQIHQNMAILKPGMSYREVAEKAWPIPEKYRERRYATVMHGCGMHGESPVIVHAMDFEAFGTEGILEPNMVLCIESFIGEVNGEEGVKLEEQVRITESGCELMTRFPFEETLLS